MGKYDPAPTFAAGVVRSIRDIAGLTQRELAERAGVSQQAISEYETGRKEPGLETVRRLADAAGLSLRVRLEPGDGHDASLEAFIDSLPPGQRAELERERRERAARARLRRVRGR